MKTEKLSFKLGDEIIRLDISIWGNSKTVYFNLHENEQTSVEAAHEVLSGGSGILIEIKSKGERLISFTLKNKTYLFDPNRMFSLKGIKDTLNEYSSYDPEAEKAIAEFANSIIEKILSYNHELIITLHNTTGEFTIENFLEDGSHINEQSAIYINPKHDKGDFFFTTDRKAFEQIKKGPYNVVLQNNETVTDDGSLSVYCAANGIRYINTEAMHGHKNEQMEMIAYLNNITFD